MPQAHRQAGERIAATIRPLDIAGAVDEQNGRILALVLGHSNCSMYFGALQRQLAQQRDKLHPRFELINAAVGGQQLPEIVALRGGVWDHAQSLLDRRPGYSRQQVQVLFLHTTYHGASNGRRLPPRPFPEVMQNMQRDLDKVLAYCVERFPNLKIAYLTCDGFRHFTGFEPHVYQEAFALKWLIESQLRGEASTRFEGPEHRLPWLDLGPVHLGQHLGPKLLHRRCASSGKGAGHIRGQVLAAPHSRQRRQAVAVRAEVIAVVCGPPNARSRGHSHEMR